MTIKTPAQVLPTGQKKDLAGMRDLLTDMISKTTAAQADADEAKDIAITGAIPQLDDVALMVTTLPTLSGEQTLDGILTSASRVLVNVVAGSASNGPWVTASGAWSRATDANTAAKIGLARVYVAGGTYGGRTYACNQKASDITLGSTALSYGEKKDESGVASLLSAEVDLRVAGDEANADLLQESLAKSVRGFEYETLVTTYGSGLVFIDKNGGVIDDSSGGGSSSVVSVDAVFGRYFLTPIDTSDGSIYVIAAIGDSYTDGGYWTKASAKRLHAKYGMAGAGAVVFGWWDDGVHTAPWTSGNQPPGVAGNARSDLVTICQIYGSWVCRYNDNTLNTPSLSAITSSTATDYVRWNFPAGHNAAVLHYYGTGSGVVQVSWDDGATWSSNVSLTGSGPQHVTLPSCPSGATTARIKVISGTVSLALVDMQGPGPGVRFHKLGGSGSNTTWWAGVDGTAWGSAIAALSPNLINLQWGANDQSSGMLPATFSSNLGTILDNIHTALPNCDRIFCAGYETARGVTYPMVQYCQAALDRCTTLGVTYVPWQPSFGAPDNQAAAYSSASNRPLLDAGGIHPTPLGCKAMSGTWLDVVISK